MQTLRLLERHDSRAHVMLRQDDGFAEMLNRVREGSEEAMLELVEKYGQLVLRTVRRKLNRELRSKFDSGDFVQAVWASFFENREKLIEFTSARQLVMFLGRLAHNKVIDQVRRRLISRGRNVSCEVPLQESDAEETVVSPGPTASEVFLAAERLQRMTAAQSIRSKLVVELRRDGATYAEIAKVLEVTPRTVQRVLERLEREVAS